MATISIGSELQGTIVGLFVEPGETVRQGAVVALIESMKMHHEVLVPIDARVVEIMTSVGASVVGGQALLSVEAISGGRVEGDGTPDRDDSRAGGEPDIRALDAAVPNSVDDRPAGLTSGRADLAEVVERHRLVSDERRPTAVGKRRERG